MTDDSPSSLASPPALTGLPWQARARLIAQRFGLDPRYVRRMRWLTKTRTVRGTGARIRDHLPFVLLDPETNNFTYEIANQTELGDWVATVAGCDQETARTYVREPEGDPLLQQRLRAATAGHWLWSHRSPRFGKRLGWYALARALKPRLVVEVGVHDGLGSLALLRALQRNRDEDGVAGRLVSFDVNPKAGWLVGTDPLWDLVLAPSDHALPGLLAGAEALDMFVYDGWHSFEHERWNLETAAAHLAPDGVLLSDDAQTTQALRGVCDEHGLRYHEFAESPRGHFYPGSVLGAGRSPVP